jgi:hypothetical protein
MKNWLLLAGCLAWVLWDEDVCTHPARGDSTAVSLEAVGKAQDEVKRRLAVSWDKSFKISADGPYESGLPACGFRQTRRIRTQLPPELVGKSIGFGPSDRIPPADIRVATSARRILEVQADAMADRMLSERLGVRCSPTLIRALSEVELELVENP